MNLLIDIDRFLRRSNMSATRFGCETVKDPRLVFDLRRGRQCGAGVRVRIYNYIAAAEGRAGQAG